LEVGGVVLARDDGEFDFFEAGFFEPGLEFKFGEAKPAVAVEFAGLFKVVAEEVENHDLAAGAKDTGGALDSLLGIGGMMEGLAQNDEIDTFGIDGRGFKVAKAEFQVLELVFTGLIGAVFDHALGVIDSNDFFGAAGEEFAEQAFTGAEVSNNERGKDPQKELAKGLPGATGAVAAVETSGDLIKVNLRLRFCWSGPDSGSSAAPRVAS